MIRKILFTLFAMIFCVPAAFAQQNPSHANTETKGASLLNSTDKGQMQLAQNDVAVMPAAPQSYTTPGNTESPYADVAAADGQSPVNQQSYDELTKRLDMMEEDIEKLLGEQDKLKEKSLLDRLNWSGSYRFNINGYHLTDTTTDDHITHLELVMGPNGAPVMGDDGRPVAVPVEAGERDRNDWLSPSWTHRLKLAMTYDFGESLRFYSQLGVYKYFNETVNTIGVIDHGSNAYPRDNAFRLERVYFDWFIGKNLAISVGRIASPDGPPTELKENADRRSGWGVQMVNATIDTVMATIYLRDKMYLRTFYSPFGTHMDYAVNNDVSLFDDQGINILHSWGALFETALPRMDDSIFQLGFLHIPQFTPRDIDLTLPGSNELISPSTPTGQDLGMFLQASALLLLKDLAHQGIDLFASYNLTLINPTANRMVYEFPVTLDIINPVTGENVSNPSTGAPLQSTSMQRVELGLASYEEGAGSKNLGHAVYAGLRYTLPFKTRYATRIGGEFNWGTKYHVAWSHPNDQLLNKLGNKGTAIEAYVIQQLVPDHLFCRIGYLGLQRKFVGTFVGPTSRVEQKIQNIYLLVDLTW